MVVDMCDTVMVITKPVECPLRLVLLDVGITTSLQPGDLTNLRNVITAVVLGEVSNKNKYATSQADRHFKNV